MHPLDDSCFISNSGTMHSNFLRCQLGDNTCLKSCVCRWKNILLCCLLPFLEELIPFAFIVIEIGRYYFLTFMLQFSVLVCFMCYYEKRNYL